MSFEVYKILSKKDLEDAIRFIHSNNFSLKTTEKKISFNFDGRILGLLIKDNGKIVGNIFYYYQPDFNYNDHNYKVVNFATIFVLESYRGKGISKLMIKKTLIALPHQHQYGSWKDVKYFLNYMKKVQENYQKFLIHQNKELL